MTQFIAGSILDEIDLIFEKNSQKSENFKSLLNWCSYFNIIGIKEYENDSDDQNPLISVLINAIQRGLPTNLNKYALDFIIEKLKPESEPEPLEKKKEKKNKSEPILDENDLLESKIPIEHVSNDTPEKRELNSDVLIKNSENKLDSEKELKEEKANERMQKNNQNEGILTLAQQMQKEREEDNNVKK